ncbi:MAG TPA: hypothetical protein VKB93_21935, partial [Thermoanaerobaculia bacterium]|nr:hypothetical protein [Thermoanaerobaculia bacterium]
AWFVVTSISTICLYLAYGIPVFLNLRNRLRSGAAGFSPPNGSGGLKPAAPHYEFMTKDLAPWTLGRWSPLLNAIAIVWIVFITFVFVLPPNELVLWTMLGVAVLLTLYWQLLAKRTFRTELPQPSPALKSTSSIQSG